MQRAWFGTSPLVEIEPCRVLSVNGLDCHVRALTVFTWKMRFRKRKSFLFEWERGGIFTRSFLTKRLSLVDMNFAIVCWRKGKYYRRE